MSIQNGVSVSSFVLGDGTSTVFKFDLIKDPYQLAPISNWLDKHGPEPVGVVPQNPGAYTATILGTVITVTFLSPVPTTGESFGVYVLFPGE